MEDILRDIRELLQKAEHREQRRSELEEIDESFSENIRWAKKREEKALDDVLVLHRRIHDRIFAINNVLLIIFLAFGRFPSEDPILSTWASLLPIPNMLLLLYLDFQEMETQRRLSNHMDWKDAEREDYGKRIGHNNLASFASIIITAVLLLILFLSLI